MLFKISKSSRSKKWRKRNLQSSTMMIAFLKSKVQEVVIKLSDQMQMKVKTCFKKKQWELVIKQDDLMMMNLLMMIYKALEGKVSRILHSKSSRTKLNQQALQMLLQMLNLQQFSLQLQHKTKINHNSLLTFLDHF